MDVGAPEVGLIALPITLGRLVWTASAQCSEMRHIAWQGTAS